MIEQAVFARLQGDAAVLALVGERVYPAPAPDKARSPYLTYQLVSTARDQTMGGPSGLVSPARLQVDAWSDESGAYAAVKALANAVRLSLDGFSGAAGGIAIDWVSLDNERDAFEQDRDWRGVSMDFLVHFQEEKPGHVD